MQPKPTLVMVELNNPMTVSQFTGQVDALAAGQVVNSYYVDEHHYVLELPDSVPQKHQGKAWQGTALQQQPPAANAPVQPTPPDPVVQTVTGALGPIGAVSQIHWCH